VCYHLCQVREANWQTLHDGDGAYSRTGASFGYPSAAQLVFPVAPFFCPACVSRASRACSPKTPMLKKDVAFDCTSEDMLEVRELAKVLLTTRVVGTPPEVSEGLCFAYFYGGNSAACQLICRGLLSAGLNELS